MKFLDSMMYSASTRLCARGLYSAMSLHLLLQTGMCDRLSRCKCLCFVPLRFCCYCCDCQLKLESRDCAKCHYPTEHTNVQDASMDATMPYGIGSRLMTGSSQTGQLPGRTKEVNCVS